MHNFVKELILKGKQKNPISSTVANPTQHILSINYFQLKTTQNTKGKRKAMRKRDFGTPNSKPVEVN